MNKRTNPTKHTADLPNPWDEESVSPEQLASEPTPAESAAEIHQATKPKTLEIEYDLDGLMTDFPTALELERFVYDEKGIVLNLKGRANKLKYQVAMDVLNGLEVDPKFLGGDNPYIDKTELVPVEDIKPTPPRDPSLPDISEVQNSFHSRFVPHPDPNYRAQDKRVDVTFRKYNNGMISYEILGPLEPKPEGEKMDKFGRMRPEIMRWIDPRSGEQVIQRADGTLTPMGRNIRALMQTFRVNDSNQWQVWIDREFISLDHSVIQNPWDVNH